MSVSLTRLDIWLDHLRRQDVAEADRLWHDVPRGYRYDQVSEALRTLAATGELDMWCTVAERYRQPPVPGEEAMDALGFRLSLGELLDHQPARLTEAQVDRLRALGWQAKDLALLWETLTVARPATVDALVRLGADPCAKEAALFRRLRSLGHWEIVEHLVHTMPLPKTGVPREVLTTIAHGLSARPSLWSVASERLGALNLAKAAISIVAKEGFVAGVQWCLDAHPEVLRPGAASGALEQAVSWHQPALARHLLDMAQLIPAAVTDAFVIAVLQNDATLIPMLAPHVKEWPTVHKNMIANRTPPEWGWLDRAAVVAPEPVCEGWVRKAPPDEMPQGRARVAALARATEAGRHAPTTRRTPRSRT